MGIENYFQVKEKDRKEFMEKIILKHLPETNKEGLLRRITKIVDDFEGRDFDALTVISYALKKGEFEAYANRLEKYFEEHLQNIPPKERTNNSVSENAESFFNQCYEELGVSHQNKNNR